MHVSNTASITQDIQKEDLIIDNAEIVMNYQNLEGENIELDVYSSCEIYGDQFKKDNDHNYQELYDQAKELSNVN